jgi:hypothetical protein
MSDRPLRAVAALASVTAAPDTSGIDRVASGASVSFDTLSVLPTKDLAAPDGRTEDFANVALFLSSEVARHIADQVINVGGHGECL